MQMAFVVIGGYAVATAPVVARFIDFLARVPRTGRGAVVYVGLVSMLASLLSWGFSLVFGGLLVRALARRTELRMDYRAAGASAYLGLGAVWAMGLSSSAAQLQANPASMPPGLVEITGVLPFTETIFLWQSIALTAVLILVSLLIAWLTAPAAGSARTAEEFPGAAQAEPEPLQRRTRPGEWLEYSPLLTVLLSLLAFGWLFNEFANKPVITAIANLNTYNFLFISLGLLLRWRRAASSTRWPGGAEYDRRADPVPAVRRHRDDPHPRRRWRRANAGAPAVEPVRARGQHRYLRAGDGRVLGGAGLLRAVRGGKWIIEAPYVMQAANELKAHLGWAVQVYNAAEALPNLINPFWMLPLLGVLGLKARDIVGFTFIQLLVHIPLVLGLLWLLGMTLAYVPPVMPDCGLASLRASSNQPRSARVSDHTRHECARHG